MLSFLHPHCQCPNPGLHHSLLDHCASILTSLSCSVLLSLNSFPQLPKRRSLNANVITSFLLSVLQWLPVTFFTDLVPTDFICWYLLPLTLCNSNSGLWPSHCTRHAFPHLHAFPSSPTPLLLLTASLKPLLDPRSPYPEPLEPHACGCILILFHSDLSLSLSL